MRCIVSILLLAATAIVASAQEWRPVATALIKAEKPGPFNLCGVVVDPSTGDLIVNLSDKGFYLSTDRGDTWKRLGSPIKGRTETPGCILLDPISGKRFVSTLVYGSPIVVSPDRGATAIILDKKSSHVDWCAIDWSDAELKFILTLKHEANGLLLRSINGGKSFDEIGKGFGPAWIFDGMTAVVAKSKSKTNPAPAILRTIDQGKTFMPVGEYNAKALPRVFKNALYWVVEGGIIRSSDQGKSWTKISDLKDGQFGPVFGKSADHMLVLTRAGIVESNDGGKTWGKVIPPPKEMKGLGSLAWLAYDANRDTVYLMKMASDLYRWDRKK